MKHGDEIKSTPDLVRVADLLRFLPEFQSRVKSIRESLKITPEIVNKERLKLFGKANFQTLQITEKSVDELDFDLNLQVPVAQQSELLRKTDDWERKRFPTLNKSIGKLRLKEFGGIPLSWAKAIKDYILYERISNQPLFSRSTFRWPSIEAMVEKDTLEPYLEIKIYGDTELSFLKKTTVLSEFQKLLPTYHKINKETSKFFYKKLVHYYLKKVKNLKTKGRADKSSDKKQDIMDVQEQYGIKQPISPEHSSQEIKRLLKLLQDSTK